MDRLWIGLALIGILLAGWVKIRFLSRKVADKLEFLYEYRNKFIDLANIFIRSQFVDHELYEWLTLNVVRAQRTVGQFGVGNYIAKFQMYKINNYQFIINTLPKFKENHIDNSDISYMESILTKSIGYYEHALSDFNKLSKNPFKCLQVGVQLLIGFPVRLLNWFGIIPNNWFYSITSSGFFKVTSGFAALIGFAAAVVGLITGWDAGSQDISGDNILKV